MKIKKEEKKLTKEQRKLMISLINNPGFVLDENGHERTNETILLKELEKLKKQWENLPNNEIN